MRTDQQGLRVGIGDTADTAAAVEIRQVLFKLGAEGRVFDVVDLALEAALLGIIDGHAAPAGTQVRVVVNTEENIKYAVPLGDCSK